MEEVAREAVVREAAVEGGGGDGGGGEGGGGEGGGGEEEAMAAAIDRYVALAVSPNTHQIVYYAQLCSNLDSESHLEAGGIHELDQEGATRLKWCQIVLVRRIVRADAVRRAAIDILTPRCSGRVCRALMLRGCRKVTSSLISISETVATLT